MDDTETIVEALSFEDTVKAGVNLKHPFFDYIGNNDKIEIMDEIVTGQSYIIAFTKDGEIKAAAIFTVYGESIHIREIGGAYVWCTKHANDYAEIIAKRLRRSKVTFKARDERIKQRSKIYGFEKSPNLDDEYERQV
jgi:hypothetical protein